MGRAGAVANAKAKDVAEGQTAGAGMPVTRAGSGMTGTMQAGSVSDGAACMWQIAPGTIVIAHWWRPCRQAVRPPVLAVQLITGMSSSNAIRMVEERRTVLIVGCAAARQVAKSAAPRSCRWLARPPREGVGRGIQSSIKTRECNPARFGFPRQLCERSQLDAVITSQPELLREVPGLAAKRLAHQHLEESGPIGFPGQPCSLVSGTVKPLCAPKCRQCGTALGIGNQRHGQLLRSRNLCLNHIGAGFGDVELDQRAGVQK